LGPVAATTQCAGGTRSRGFSKRPKLCACFVCVYDVCSVCVCATERERVYSIYPNTQSCLQKTLLHSCHQGAYHHIHRHTYKEPLYKNVHTHIHMQSFTNTLIQGTFFEACMEATPHVIPRAPLDPPFSPAPGTAPAPAPAPSPSPVPAPAAPLPSSPERAVPLLNFYFS
jgi:hypothetical protein